MRERIGAEPPHQKQMCARKPRVAAGTCRCQQWEALSHSIWGPDDWKSPLSPMGTLQASLSHPSHLKAFMHTIILKCSLDFSEGCHACCPNTGTGVRARQDTALPGDLLLCGGFQGHGGGCCGPRPPRSLGVSVRKLRERYLWFQCAGSPHKVTIGFLDVLGHRLKPQPGESSCKIQRERRLLRRPALILLPMAVFPPTPR